MERIKMNISNIDIDLCHQLIKEQFPQWGELAITPVACNGWDNNTFHLGNEMLIRMPCSEEYAAQVEKEQCWLPKLGPSLPLEIPSPLALGLPAKGYPWHWSIYRWIPGESAAPGNIKDLLEFAKTLANFLKALQSIDPTGGPPPGQHSFHRGGTLSTYDTEVQKALSLLKERIDVKTASQIWKAAISTTWQGKPVWVHGDISTGNLLVEGGTLTAVIDFGQLAVGDPACDLAIAWTLFQGRSRKLFQKHLGLDKDTWNRAKGWALWKALITAAGLTSPNNFESKQSWTILGQLIDENI
ncbi:MAG: aminoglycoside phosphotransferase family protein [Simkaniaceae bacterium]|nr:aminoglycoside phosphotransferase family protein [Candidatus Sacchlamyda saccharinae]